MEANRRPENQPPPPPPDEAVTEFSGAGLTRSNSTASSLNATMDNYRAWTNEKHNSYLNHLEASFVEQLYQSMSCTEQKKSVKTITNRKPAEVNNEGVGQNFVDQGCQKNQSNSSKQERLKRVSKGISSTA